MEILERVQEFCGALYQSGSMDEVLESVERGLSEEDKTWCDTEIEEK